MKREDENFPMPKIGVSIVIPVYNEQDFIDSRLRSVIGQIFIGSLECILVDNCIIKKRKLHLIDVILSKCNIEENLLLRLYLITEN